MIIVRERASARWRRSQAPDSFGSRELIWRGWGAGGRLGASAGPIGLDGVIGRPKRQRNATMCPTGVGVLCGSGCLALVAQS